MRLYLIQDGNYYDLALVDEVKGKFIILQSQDNSGNGDRSSRFRKFKQQELAIPLSKFTAKKYDNKVEFSNEKNLPPRFFIDKTSISFELNSKGLVKSVTFQSKNLSSSSEYYIFNRRGSFLVTVPKHKKRFLWIHNHIYTFDANQKIIKPDSNHDLRLYCPFKYILHKKESVIIIPNNTSIKVYNKIKFPVN